MSSNRPSSNRRPRWTSSNPPSRPTSATFRAPPTTPRLTTPISLQNTPAFQLQQFESWLQQEESALFAAKQRAAALDEMARRAEEVAEPATPLGKAGMAISSSSGVTISGSSPHRRVAPGGGLLRG